VYAVGYRSVSGRGRLLAAVMAGRTATTTSVLSHRSAGRLHGVLRSGGGVIDVTSTGRHDLPGIRWHTARTLHPEDLTVIGAIPVTTIARTFLDLAETLHPQRLHDALEQSLRRQTFDLRAIEATIARNPGRHGTPVLTDTLRRLPDLAPRYRSDLELDLGRALREEGLPLPHTDAVVEGEVVDFLWPDRRLIVEVDGDPYHRLASDRAADARKDRKLTRAGFTVVRVQDVELATNRQQVVEDICALL
jgi:very-short-patch-repair endonuclease